MKLKGGRRNFLKRDVSEMEMAQAKNNSHELFKRVKKLAKERDKTQLAARNKEGILKTAPAEVMKCWEEHFATHLNKYTIPKGQQCTTVNPRSSPCQKQ